MEKDRSTLLLELGRHIRAEALAMSKDELEQYYVLKELEELSDVPDKEVETTLNMMKKVLNRKG